VLRKCCDGMQELQRDLEVVYPRRKKRRVRKANVTFDVTSDDTLLSNEKPPISATDGSDGGL